MNGAALESGAGPILVTGAAGFIGYHVARRLLNDGLHVVGIDNLNTYYDPALKQARLAELATLPAFQFDRLDLADRAGMTALFETHRFPYVVHLGGQAGVRYSLIDPHAYIDSNVSGFLNVLEGCRQTGCRHLIYGSSSSVYGANTRLPFRTSDNVDHPLSLYAATKKSNEGMAHAYANIYGLAATGLRFFTVYGPWGRPDMALWLFADAILSGRPIRLFNNGNMRRDFTYVDDIVEPLVRLLPRVAQRDPAWSGTDPSPATSASPWRLYNIGSNRPVELREVVRLLEEALGRKAICELAPMQPGDVTETFADVDDLAAAVDFRPRISIAEGIRQFIAWFLDYRGRAKG